MLGSVRSYRTGMSTELSKGLRLNLKHVCSYGIGGKISAMAYDPVQSLIAIGTAADGARSGQVLVFGGKRARFVIDLKTPASVRKLYFWYDKLVIVDDQHYFSVAALKRNGSIVDHQQVLEARLSAVCCDPTLDYIFIGTEKGIVLAWDLTIRRMTRFRIPFLWHEDPSRVISIAIHPRDLGTLLIAYAAGAVTYSFQHEKPINFYGYSYPLVHAVWHPTGTFILTSHTNGALVLWDANTAKEITVMKQGLFCKVSWCTSGENPEDTYLVLAGERSLDKVNLGRTPIYAASTSTSLATYFQRPFQHLIPVSPYFKSSSVSDFCLITRYSPYYNGSHDPEGLIVLLSSGDIISTNLRALSPLAHNNSLPISLSLAHSQIEFMTATRVPLDSWRLLKERRKHSDKLITGGKMYRPPDRSAPRNVVQTAHRDGSVLLWDSGHGDEVEMEGAIRVDISTILANDNGTWPTKVSFAAPMRQLSVAVSTGELVVFQWKTVTESGCGPSGPGSFTPGRFYSDIAGCVDGQLREGFVPRTLLYMARGKITALKHSDVGFIAVGYEDGSLIIINFLISQPGIIWDGKLSQPDRKVSRKSSHLPSSSEFATSIEFSIMNLEKEQNSTINCHVGTSGGGLLTFKVQREQGLNHSVAYVDCARIGEKAVISISPIQNDGKPAHALLPAMPNVGKNTVGGVLAVVTPDGCRIIKPPASSKAHKDWRGCCTVAEVSYLPNRVALVTLSDSSGTQTGGSILRVFSIPGLSELGEPVDFRAYHDPRSKAGAAILPSGEILSFTGPTEAFLVNIWGTVPDASVNETTMYDGERIMPSRPEISLLEMATTRHVRPIDVDKIVGDGGKVTKAMLREADTQRRDAQKEQAGASQGTGAAGGYWGAIQRQVNDGVSAASNAFGTVAETATKALDGADERASKAKRNLVLGAVRSKFT